MRPLRQAVGLAAALLIAAALGFVPALAPERVAAATPSLTIVGAATYDVLPEEGRVAVRVKLTATNRLKNTSTKRFFFRTGFITVLPGTSAFKLSGGSGTPKVSVSSKTDTYTNLKIDLGANLAAGKSTTLTLTFDIRDPGGAPDRAIRISRSIVSFAAWAVATPETKGASVDVRMPTGYGVTVGRGPLDGPIPEGTDHELWSSGTLAKPLDFVADVSADRPTDYVETSLSIDLSTGPATVLLRAWPDDAAWRDRVSSLVQRALPILEEEIGVPWPIDGPLAVHEALIRNTGGYAGLFDPAQRSIEIAYAAPDGVVLHELAHAWFNGRLVADRWAAEAFASYYAGLIAAKLGVDPAAPVLPSEPSPAAIPLNAWGPSGSEPTDSETWAYAASLQLAREIASRARDEGLRVVWSKAAHGTGAYQPGPTTVEPADGPPDWRGLIDLLEDNTTGEFGDLWRTWVARPEDVPLLADRAVARAQYEESVALAREWELPPAARQAMRAWRFDVARELLAASDVVQGQRDQLKSTSEAAGLTLPDRLRATFEGPGGVAAAASEANAEQATVDAIVAAQAARPTATGIVDDVFTAVGLFFDAPDRRLATAQEALTSGDLQTAYAEAQMAEASWRYAGDVGRSRLLSVALLLVAFVLLIGLVRERRRRKREPAPEPTG
jgi:hypothetical protein